MCVNNRFFIVVSLFLSGLLAHAEDTHIVQKGETVYQLSKRYGIPVDVLLETNQIADPSVIPAGQSIQIPDVLSSRTVKAYTVKKGDTLYAIAHEHGLKLPELRAINKGIEETIKVGQIINVMNVPSEKEPAYIAKSQSGSVDSKSQSGNADSKNSRATTSTTKEGSLQFGNGQVVSKELLGNSISVGKVSSGWPVSGQGYLLQGKLPGILIEGNENQVVTASAGGVVLYAALHSSFNNVVVIQGNDGIVYVYAGQKVLTVKQGDRIDKGNKIGLLGVMPTLQKSVLYFSLWNKNKFVDPRRKITG